MNKIYTTQGGAFKSVLDAGGGIRDSWDFAEAMAGTNDVDLYAKVSAVYRAANLTADAVSNVPFAVMRNDTDIDTSAEWQNTIGIMPNPRELLRLWTLSLIFNNAAYGRIAKTNSVKRRVFYVMPQNVEIVTDPVTGAVKELQRKANGFIADRYNPTDYKNFVYCWHLDHTTELLPSANTDFKAMMQAAGIMYAADFWAGNYFKNGAVKPTIVTVKGMVTGDKKDELQKGFAKFVRSIGSKFSELAKVINGDAMDIKSFGDGLGDIKESPVYRQAIENVAMASGMPLSLLLANSANYATAQAEYAAWFRDKITPRCFEIQEWLNEQMFNPAGLYFEFRPEQSEPSQQEEVERASAYSTYISAGMKPSIAAQVVGLDLPAGFEYDDLDPKGQEQPEPAAPATPAPAAEAEDTPEDDTEDMTEDTGKALSFEAWQELDIWKRKATKAAKRAEALPLDFVCRHIPDNYADTIRTLLVRGDVGAAFAVKREFGSDEERRAAFARMKEDGTYEGDGGGSVPDAVQKARDEYDFQRNAYDTGKYPSGYSADRATVSRNLRRAKKELLSTVEKYKNDGHNIPDTILKDVKSFDDNSDLATLAAAINAATAAAMQPATKAQPVEDNKQMLSIKADNVTIQNDEAIKTMQAIADGMKALTQAAPQIVVNVPPQPAPIVNIEAQPAPVITVNVPEQPAPVVNVAAPVINMPERKPITAEITTDPRTGKKTIKAK